MIREGLVTVLRALVCLKTAHTRGRVYFSRLRGAVLLMATLRIHTIILKFSFIKNYL